VGEWYHIPMGLRFGEGGQMEMFPAIENAWCYDETRPGKKDFHQDLIPAGADRFVNADGDVYERAVSKGDGVERFICIRKKGKSAAAASAPASGGGAPRTATHKKHHPPRRYEQPLDPMMR